MADSLPNSPRIGIDLGGTKTAIGLVGNDGNLFARKRLETKPHEALGRLVDAIAASAEELGKASHCDAPSGFGVGCAGPVDPRTGRLENPDTLPNWFGENLLERLRSALGLSICALDNDANAAVLAEALYGAGRGVERTFMLTIGTGVGAALYDDGRLYRGVQGAHPEFGMLPVCLEDDSIPDIGRTLEELASGTGLTNTASRLGRSRPNAKDVFRAATEGDELAARAVALAERAMEWAGRVIAQTYLPEVIVLAGGVMASEFDRYAAALRRGLAQGRLVPGDAIRVERARLGDDCGILGAAALLDHGIRPEFGRREMSE